MYVTSRAADGRLFMRGRNELHVRSDRWPKLARPARTLAGGLYSNAGWLKIADGLHYTRLRPPKLARVIPYIALVEVLHRALLPFERNESPSGPSGLSRY